MSSVLHVQVVDVEQNVRQHAGPAALASALLIFFGFFWFGTATGSETFLAAHKIFMLSLRLGGLAMLAVAVSCCFGTPWAMLADAIVSMLIGIGLLLAAVLMTIVDGVNLAFITYFIVGVMFLTSGIRSGRDYATLPPLEPEVPSEEEEAAVMLATGDGKLVVPEPAGVRADVGVDEEPIVFDKKPTKSARPSQFDYGHSDDDDDVIRLDDAVPPRRQK